MSVQTEELQVKFSETGAGSLESAYQRLEQRNNALDQSSRRASSGLHLVSDKKFAHNMQDIIREFSSGASTADVLANSVYRVGYSFKGSLGLLLAAGIGFSVFERITQDADLADKAVRNLARDLALPGGTRMPDQLAGDFRRVLEEAEAATAATKTFGAQVVRGLDRYVNPLVGTRSHHVAENQDSVISSGMVRAGDLLKERAAVEERISGIRATSIHQSERQAALDQIELERSVKRSAIDRENTDFRLQLFDKTAQGKLDPKTRDKLIKDSNQSAERRKETADKDAGLSVEETTKKFDRQKESVLELTRLSQFRGSTEAQIANTLASELATAERHNKAAVTEKEMRDAGLEVAKAQKAIDEYRLSIAEKLINLRASTASNKIQTQAARASVDASPDDQQRIQLEAAHREAVQGLLSASQRAAKERASIDSIKAMGQAAAEVAIIEEKQKKFEKETKFEREQSLKAAKATTTEMQLQANGQDYLAQVVRTHAFYEARIAQAIKDRRPDIEAELRLQQKLELSAERYARWKQTGGHPDEPTQGERAEKLTHDRFEQAESDDADRRRRGAYTHHPDAYGDSSRGPSHPDAYQGPGDAYDSGRQIGRQRDWQLDRPRRGSMGEPMRRKSDEEWRDQFQPRSSSLRDQAEMKRTEKETSKNEDPNNGAAGLIGEVRKLVSTIEALPNKIGVL